jgi:hypothetical protein
MSASRLDRYVIGRDGNVVRVDFGRHTEPPPPLFPGSGALRVCEWLAAPGNFSTSNKAEVA